MEELVELIEEFATSVFSFRAFVGIVVMIVLFVIEVKWTRSHTPRNKRVEKALKLGHVVEAKRVKFWDDAITPDEGQRRGITLPTLMRLPVSNIRINIWNANILLWLSSCIIGTTLAKSFVKRRSRAPYSKYCS